MRALDPEVANAVWAAAKGLLPAREDNHPLGCHNPRKPDRVCFQGMLIRLVFGCSWETAEQLLNKEVSDTTLRARRDEWMKAGVFDKPGNRSRSRLRPYDRVGPIRGPGRRQRTQSALRRGRNRQRTPATGPNPARNGPWP